MLTERVNRIALSPTLKLSQRAAKMKAQGVDVVDFTIGEPDFPSPEAAKQAAKAALDANFTKYVHPDGILELRSAIAEKLRRDNGLSYETDEIIVSPGAKNSIYNVVLSLFGPGDDVLIPAPFWVSYPDQVVLSGANPVLLRTREQEGFKLMPSDLAAAVTPNTKGIILNYPSNPTGAVYSRAELAALAEICVKEGIWIISDEIYEKLIYGGQRFVSIASVDERVKKITIVINGFSKAFSMTGWRLGYAAGPKEVIAACSKIQSHTTSGATSFAQKGALEALRSSQMDVERMRQEFERRKNAVLYRLRAIPGVSVASPDGAFYAFPNVSRYLDKEFGGAPVRNTYGLAYYLLKEARVAVVPGEAFGSPEHIRISFATAMDRIEEGMKRLAAGLARLESPRRLRPRQLNNVLTKVSRYAEVRAVPSLDERNALLAEAERHLPADAYFEWNAAIGGVVVQLRTNSPHLADFFQENFYPAPLEGDIAPHAVIYAVKDMPGREPAALLSLPTATAFAFNTAFYGQVRTLALVLAADAATRISGALFVHAAAIDRGGRGALLWGMPGSGRTGLLAELLREDGVKLVGNDALLVRLSGADALVDLVERKLYLKAKWGQHFPEIEKLLDRAKLENLVTTHDQCTVEYCPIAQECTLDRGAAACLAASGSGRILLDPAWLGGGRQHVRRTVGRLAVLLAKDPALPSVQELSPRDAARYLSGGQLPGARGPAIPYLNPHLVGVDAARNDALRAQYERLFACTRAVVVNSGVGSREAIARRVLELL